MKRLNKILVGLLAVGLLSTHVVAEESKVIAGLKTGQYKPTGGLDGKGATGVSLAYRATDNWSAELSLLNGSVRGFGGKVDVDTVALYATYRSSGDTYFMGKVGLLSEDVSNGYSSESDTGLSVGIGGGYRVNEKLSVEIEYSLIEDDINFLGIGVYVSF